MSDEFDLQAELEKDQQWLAKRLKTVFFIFGLAMLALTPFARDLFSAICFAVVGLVYLFLVFWKRKSVL